MLGEITTSNIGTIELFNLLEAEMEANIEAVRIAKGDAKPVEGQSDDVDVL